jgi:hypothetical protein
MIFRLLLLASVLTSVASPQSYRLSQPESLTYRVEWRLVTAGSAKLQWQPQGPQDGYQIRLHLESVGLVSKLFKVDDNYTGVLNQSGCIVNSQLTAREGSRQRDTRVNYDYESRKAYYQERDRVKNTTTNREVDLPGCVHDVIGGLYFLRNLNLEVGQSTQMAVSDGRKAVMARVTAQQRETVKVPDGTYPAIRYEIFLFDGVLFDRSAHLYVWLSDDQRKIPVQIRVRMQFTIGTITFELEKRE